MPKLLKKVSIFSFIFSLLLISAFGIGNKAYAVTNKHVIITFVGNLESGKTALRARLTNRNFDFELRQPTMMSDRIEHIVEYDANTRLVCTLWDTSGQPSVKDQILNHRIRGSHFVAIAVDMAAALKAGFNNLIEQCIVEWCEAVRRNTPDSKIILVGTKLDLVDPARIPEIRERFEAIPRIFVRFNSVLTSALRGDGLTEFFDIVKRKVNVATLPVYAPAPIPAIGERDDATHRNQGGRCNLL